MNALTTELHDEIAKIAFATNHPTLARIQDELRTRMEAEARAAGVGPAIIRNIISRQRQHPQHAEIAADYRAGMGINDLKRKYRTGDPVIYRALDLHNVTRREGTVWELAAAARRAEIAPQVLSMVRGGVSQFETSKQLGISSCLVRRILLEATA